MNEPTPYEEHIKRGAGALRDYLRTIPVAYRGGGDETAAAEFGHTVHEEARLAAEARRRDGEQHP